MCTWVSWNPSNFGQRVWLRTWAGPWVQCLGILECWDDHAPLAAHVHPGPTWHVYDLTIPLYSSGKHIFQPSTWEREPISNGWEMLRNPCRATGWEPNFRVFQSLWVSSWSLAGGNVPSLLVIQAAQWNAHRTRPSCPVAKAIPPRPQLGPKAFARRNCMYLLSAISEATWQWCMTEYPSIYHYLSDLSNCSWYSMTFAIAISRCYLGWSA